MKRIAATSSMMLLMFIAPSANGQSSDFYADIHLSKILFQLADRELLFVILRSMCFPSEGASRQETPSAELHRQAEEARNRKDWARAEELYRRLTRLEPSNADAWFWLGTAAMNQNQLDDGIAALERSIALKDNAQARYNLAIGYGIKNDLGKAVPNLKRAVELRPEYDLAWGKLADAQFKLGHLKEARDAIQQALRLKPGDSDYASLARRIDADLALPQEAWEHRDRGDLLYRQGKYPEAKAEEEAALRLAPDCAGCRYDLGMTLANMGDFRGAREQLVRFVKLEPGSDFGWVALAKVNVQVGLFDEALAAANEARKLNPKDSGNTDLAFGIEGLIAMQSLPKEARAHFFSGEQLAEAGQFEKARAEYLEVLRVAPNCADCHYNLGRIARRLGDYAGAEREYRSAIAGYGPNSELLRADAENNLADLLVERGAKTDEPLTLVRDAISLRGERWTYLDTLGRACDLRQDQGCALGAYTKLLALGANLPAEVRSHAEERIRSLTPSK